MALREACAVPYREGARGLEFLVITNRKGKWIFPKGILHQGASGPATAAKEALEEAGVRGAVAEVSFTAYPDHKWDEDMEVEVYLLRVEEVLPTWEEDDVRVRRWLDVAGIRETIRRKLRPVFEAALRTLAEGDPARIPRVG